MQIRRFFLNSGTSSKNFELTKYSLIFPEKIFSKGTRISKKKEILNFFRKTLRSILNSEFSYIEVWFTG